MENVYALVKRFYSAHGRANIFVPRALIERYLRAAAWRGRSNEDLCTDWHCIEDFLFVIQENQFYKDAYLTIYNEITGKQDIYVWEDMFFLNFAICFTHFNGFLL